MGPDPTPEGAATPPAPDGLTRQEVGTLAIRGGVLVVARGIVVRLIAFSGMLVLARQLAPHDFGVLAFGLSMLAVSTLLADGGIGASLIRRQDAPGRAELGAVVGFQMVVTAAVAVVATALVPLTGLRVQCAPSWPGRCP